MDKDLIVKYSEKIKGIVVMRIEGGITNDTTPELHKICVKIGKSGADGILLDFSAVTDIDTSAFACVIGFIKEHSQNGMKIGIINLNKKDKALIDILRISGIINIFSDKDKAVEVLSGGDQNA